MVPMLVVAASAQSQDDATKVKIKVEVEKALAEAKAQIDGKFTALGGAMGQTVKGAPYSAVEVTESTQVLADGTRIHNESQVSVYRDSEGRMRRETPDGVTIWDPVTNASYFLNPKDQSVRKLRMLMYNTFDKSVANDNVRYEVRSTNGGVTSVMVNGQPVDPSTLKGLPLPPPPDARVGTFEGQVFLTGEAVANKMARTKKTPGNTESLGKQTVAGLPSDGTRTTTTLEAGAIGNDRPIQIVAESWYSPELQTVVMSKHNDPRTGEEAFHLVNVSRTEPPAYLFQVPAGYQSSEHNK